MTALAWITLAAGSLLGGGIGAAIGYWLGKRGVAQQIIAAATADEAQANESDVAAKEKNAAAAKEAIAKLPTDTPDELAQTIWGASAKK